MEGKVRILHSVMSASIPSSVSVGSSTSGQYALLLEIYGVEGTTLDDPGMPTSGHKSLEGDEIVNGDEKPKGGRTGGESSSSPLLLSLPLPFEPLVARSSGI